MSGWLSVSDVALDLGVDPQSVRIQARKDKSALGFNICMVGSRIFIPEEGYKRFKEGGTVNERVQIFPSDDEAL